MKEKVQPQPHASLEEYADHQKLPTEAFIRRDNPDNDGGYLVADDDRNALADDSEPQVVGVYKLVSVEKLSPKRTVATRLA